MDVINIPIQEKAWDAFYVGVGIGMLSWIIGSPVLGVYCGYSTGSIVGQIIGAILLGFLFGKTAATKRIIIGAAVASFSLPLIYYSGLTVVIKEMLDKIFSITNDKFYVISYMLVYGIFSLLLRSFFISINSIKDDEISPGN